MARDGAIYVCQACGAVHAKWAGQCGASGMRPGYDRRGRERSGTLLFPAGFPPDFSRVRQIAC